MMVKCIANDKKDIESKFWTTVDDYIRRRLTSSWKHIYCIRSDDSG